MTTKKENQIYLFENMFVWFCFTLVLNVVSLTYEIYSQLYKNNKYSYQNPDDKPYVMLIYLFEKNNGHKYCIHIELVDRVLTFYDESLCEHC